MHLSRTTGCGVVCYTGDYASDRDEAVERTAERITKYCRAPGAIK